MDGRFCRDRLNALPLWGNRIYLWALRPDGMVFCVDHESFSRATEPEIDPLNLFAVLQHGAARYPELAPLLPDAPAGALSCDTCGGAGWTDEGGSCMSCFGLGWLIPGSR